MSGPVSNATESLNALAEEFLARYRCGERPSVDEYAARHAELAGAIRELFPALVLMEELAPPVREPAGPAGTGLPRRLGEYRLGREIGRGGMAVVYEAVQESLGRRVAVKVLPTSLRQGKYRQRFEQEARAAARLHHTNIVPVFGVGEQDGLPYYVMQLIDGRGLDDILRDARADRGRGVAVPPITVLAPGLPPATSQSRPGAPSPTTEAAPPAETFLPPGPVQLEGGYFRAVARLGLQAAEALAHAHAQGVLHRDVKPSNLLVDVQGTLWVADFGLAKVDDRADLTEQGDVVGTLRYMAPERFRGQCDARADVYSLGATLYEMATLHPAFEQADRARLIERILGGSPPARPRRWAPNLPPDLETILLKAMAHDAADRYPSAEALAEDLRRFLADRPILARRSSVLERLRRWRRRNPVVAWLTSAVVGLTLLLAVGSTLAAAWLLSALSESEAARKEQREHLWRSLIQQARANRRSGRMGQRVESLRTLEEAARIQPTVEVRNEVIACLALTDLEEVGRLPDFHLSETAAWSVDFRQARYACSDLAGAIVVRSLADGRILAQLDSRGEGVAGNAQLSPGGRYLVQHARPAREVRLWDLSGPQPKVVLSCNTGPTDSAVVFRGDERQVAVRQALGSANVYDLPAGRLVHRLRPRTAEQVMLHPRRPWLAFSGQKALRVIDLDSKREIVRLDLPAPIETAAWSPDGERLAVACHDHNIYLWDVASRQILFTLEGHQDVGMDLNFHPSGRVLISSVWNGPVRLWDVASGRQLLCSTPKLGPWSGESDPLSVAQEGAELRAYRLILPRVFYSRAYEAGGARKRLEGARINPDGRRLAIGAADVGTVLFDLLHPTAPPTLVVADQDPVRFDPSGALWTSSRTELRRWPLAFPPGGTGHVGPPEKRFAVEYGAGWSCAADGRLAAVGSYDEGALLFRADRPGTPLRLGPQGDVRTTALSPDGRWVATASHWRSATSGVKVWDARNGQLVKVLSSEGGNLQFSPDSRYLGLVGPSVRLWRTDSWEEVPAVSGRRFAFSPDGLLAVADGEAIRLLGLETREEFARLEAPQESDPIPQCFSADGTLLIATGSESDSLMVWDLRALRDELAARGLDWDRPAYLAERP